jgi:hypothetical protein
MHFCLGQILYEELSVVSNCFVAFEVLTPLLGLLIAAMVYSLIVCLFKSYLQFLLLKIFKFEYRKGALDSGTSP